MKVEHKMLIGGVILCYMAPLYVYLDPASGLLDFDGLMPPSPYPNKFLFFFFFGSEIVLFMPTITALLYFELRLRLNNKEV